MDVRTILRSIGYMRPLSIWGMHIALKGRSVEGATAMGEARKKEEREIKSSVLI